jgi:hypothetical protein
MLEAYNQGLNGKLNNASETIKATLAEKEIAR